MAEGWTTVEAPSSSSSNPIDTAAIGGPDDETLDHILKNILAIVSDDHLSCTCGFCNESDISLSHCVDCNKLLCDNCVRIHQDIRLTKYHKIQRISGVINRSRTISLGSVSGSPDMPSSNTMSLSPRSPVNNNNVCGHDQAHDFFCNTCHISVCAVCYPEDHSTHEVYFVKDAFDSVISRHRDLNMETRTTMLVIKDAAEGIQRTLMRLNMNSTVAVSEVRMFMRRSMSILKQREKVLLDLIENARRCKIQQLAAQMASFQMGFSKLSQSFEALNEHKGSRNVHELFTINEKVANELKRFSPSKSNLLPCQDDIIKFTPDENFLISLGGLGTVSFGTPLLTSNMLTVCPMNETSFVQHNIPNELTPHIDPLETLNQAIHGTVSPVVFRKEDCKEFVCTNVGGYGTREGELCRPWGVCCNRFGDIIVADRSNDRIQVFDCNGMFLYTFGSHGIRPGQFHRPAGLAVSPEDNIIVADKDNHRVQVFRIDGSFIFAFGEKGTLNGQFNYPWDVACNHLSQIVVSDSKNHRIQLFSSNGIFLGKYGFEGYTTSMWKELDSPRGVCFTPTGDIIVTDFNNHRLMFIDKYLRNTKIFAEDNYHDKKLSWRPQAIFCDDCGNIVITDSKNQKIQVFNINGEHLWTAGHRQYLSKPSGICLNPQGRIIVVDSEHHKIKIF